MNMEEKTRPTWALHAVTKVNSEAVHNVEEEGEVSHVVHVDLIWVRGDGPKLVLVSILDT